MNKSEWESSPTIRNPRRATRQEREAVNKLVSSLGKVDLETGWILAITRRIKKRAGLFGWVYEHHAMQIAALNRVLNTHTYPEYTLAKHWADLLESGKYRHGAHYLRNYRDQYSCIGVACDAYLEGEWEKHKGYQEPFYFVPVLSSPYASTLKILDKESNVLFEKHFHLQNVLTALSNASVPEFYLTPVQPEHKLATAFLRSLPKIEECRALFEEYQGNRKMEKKFLGELLTSIV